MQIRKNWMKLMYDIDRERESISIINLLEETGE